MKKKITIILIIISLLTIIGYILNNAKNEYLKDQIFIAIQKNVKKHTQNKINTDIGDIQCSGFLNTDCNIENLDFYLSTTDKNKVSVFEIDKLSTKIYIIDLLLKNINQEFYIKNLHFNKEFISKREFNPVISYDIQEMMSVLKKYGHIDIKFNFSKNNIEKNMYLKLNIYNELVDFSIDAEIVQEKDENKKLTDLIFKKLKISLHKKDFNRKFFNILKEREPSYFKKYDEDFIYNTVIKKYKEYSENKFMLKFDPINEFFVKDNVILILSNKKDKTISFNKDLNPFFLDLEYDSKIRDFNETMNKINMNYSVKKVQKG